MQIQDRPVMSMFVCLQQKQSLLPSLGGFVWVRLDDLQLDVIQVPEHFEFIEMENTVFAMNTFPVRTPFPTVMWPHCSLLTQAPSISQWYK